MITDQKFQNFDDFLIATRFADPTGIGILVSLPQHCPSAAERRASACGNTRILTVPGTVLRQEPKSRKVSGGTIRDVQRDPIGYVGGINLYEYVAGRAVVTVDPEGNACVPCSQCYQNYDKELGQLLRQMDRELAGFTNPFGSPWHIVGAAGSSAAVIIVTGSGPIGGGVFLGIGVIGEIGKIIEFSQFMSLYNQEKRGILDAFNNCLKNCKQ
jgi:hypothetical protein